MAELAQLPRPVMCRSARLHSDHGRRQLGKKRQHLAAPQLPAQHRPLGGINPMQLKNMLRRIHSNSDNLVHGRLPCLRLQQPHSGTLDAVGGRPHHHAARILAMKRSSSWRNRVLSLDSVRAEFSTSSDADPVSVAAGLTLVILAAAYWVPCATL